MEAGVIAMTRLVVAFDTTQRQQLAQGETEIEFLDYDWRLTRVP